MMAGLQCRPRCLWRPPMPGLLPDIDPDGLLEFSVVYTDRALNHMSKRFAGVMQDILTTLQEVYHAHTAVLVPGSGTRSEEHTSELQSQSNLVCRLLLEKKKPSANARSAPRD